MGWATSSRRSATSPPPPTRGRAEALSLRRRELSAAEAPEVPHRWDQSGSRTRGCRSARAGGRRWTMETLALRPLAFLVRGFLDASSATPSSAMMKLRRRGAGDTTAASRTSSSELAAGGVG